MPTINPTFILLPQNDTLHATGTTAESGFSFSELLAGEIKELVTELNSDLLTSLFPKSTSTKDTEQDLLTDLQNIAGQLAVNVVPFVAITRAPDNTVLDTSPSEAMMPVADTAITDSPVTMNVEQNSNSAVLAAPLAKADEFANGFANLVPTTEKIPAHSFPKPVTSDTINETIHNAPSIQHVNNTGQGLSDVQPTTIAPLPTSNFAVDMNHATNAVPTIHQRVGTPGWDQALGQKINWMVLGGQQSASLTLNPPDLGPLQVVIHVNDQHAEATFSAHQPEVRAALESAIPKLREMLEQSGIQLGDCNVNSQGGQQRQLAQRQMNSDYVAGSINNPESTVGLIHTSPIISGVSGLIDTFV